MRLFTFPTKASKKRQGYLLKNQSKLTLKQKKKKNLITKQFNRLPHGLCLIIGTVNSTHYANFQWNALALGKPVAQLDEWIQQSEESCEEKDKWLLCVKISRQGSFVLWDSTHWNDLKYSNTYRAKYCYLEFTDFWSANSRQIKEQSV